MGIEENKKTLLRFFNELYNNQDYSKADEILHEDFVGMLPPIKGIEGQKQNNQLWHSAAPDLHYEILEMLAEGDKVVVFLEFTCTLTGDFQGIQGRGQQITRRPVVIYEFKDGKIIRGATRVVNDALSFYQQLGALPPTEEIVKSYNDSLK
ncbi:MAG TPA: ester cyclase [Dehalococcoidia bacterium]|nr:ester cyclase [Dehalococcoidia bacterium]